MPLTGKYLKYHESITFEIFEKIYNKLFEEKWCCKNSIKTEYPWFAKYGYITHEEPQQQRNFATHRCIYGLEETTVQEILGYDPFVNKEVIPEYVECIGLSESKVQGWSNHFTIGNVYKINSIPNDKFTYILGDDGDEWACDYSQFKPSTKEAFDAQNQPKQPLKQAVHCKTQEEWDFVTEKLGYKWEFSNWNKYEENSYISLNEKQNSTKDYWIKKDYQILSLQEWCDLNGYKMGKEVKFEVGKWYKYENWYIKYLKHDNGIWTASEYINDKKSYRNLRTSFGRSDSDSEKVLASIEEIQQYLPENHPNKIKSNQEFKVGDYIFVMIKGKNFGDILKVTDFFTEKESSYSGVWINHKPSSFGGSGFRLNGNGYVYGKDVRHATPEEINNHLISIGQTPTFITNLQMGLTVKDPFYGVVGHPTTGNCYNKDFSTSIVPGPLKMTLSIDDEELPMVNIIKTKTVNLLNLE